MPRLKGDKAVLSRWLYKFTEHTYWRTTRASADTRHKAKEIIKDEIGLKHLPRTTRLMRVLNTI